MLNPHFLFSLMNSQVSTKELPDSYFGDFFSECDYKNIAKLKNANQPEVIEIDIILTHSTVTFVTNVKNHDDTYKVFFPAIVSGRCEY